jgi:exodeoxyribonuclease VII large subunit
MTFFSATSDTASTHVWTVGALCHAISDQLKSRFGLVHVRGEISGLTRAGSGHCYLTLKDEQGQLQRA